jgi:hypothetical protein
MALQSAIFFAEGLGGQEHECFLKVSLAGTRDDAQLQASSALALRLEAMLPNHRLADRPSALGK